MQKSLKKFNTILKWCAEENLVVNNKDNRVFVSELCDSFPLAALGI